MTDPNHKSIILTPAELRLAGNALRLNADEAERYSRSRKMAGPALAAARAQLRDHAAEQRRLAQRLDVVAIGKIPRRDPDFKPE